MELPFISVFFLSYELFDRNSKICHLYEYMYICKSYVVLHNSKYNDPLFCKQIKMYLVRRVNRSFGSGLTIIDLERHYRLAVRIRAYASMRRLRNTSF